MFSPFINFLVEKNERGNAAFYFVAKKEKSKKEKGKNKKKKTRPLNPPPAPAVGDEEEEKAFPCLLLLLPSPPLLLLYPPPLFLCLSARYVTKSEKSAIARGDHVGEHPPNSLLLLLLLVLLPLPPLPPPLSKPAHPGCLAPAGAFHTVAYDWMPWRASRAR